MRSLACALFALLLSAAAAATTVSTDYSDMWWNDNESGWGANVIQQGDTLFVTLFVYDAQMNPVWYVAPATAFQGGGKFTGPLYAAKGPWYGGGRFDPAQVATNQIGDVTFEFTDHNHATLTYRVGGFVIKRVVTRQTWRMDSYAGLYKGSRQGRWMGCDASLNGRVDSFAELGISQQGDQIQVRDAGTRYTCNFTGKLLPAGRFNEIEGEGVCDDNVGRYFKATEVQVSQTGFSFRYKLETVGSLCRFDGYVGGIRQLP
jgi:hypothetical protein